MEDNITFGDLIRFILKTLNISIFQLAKTLDVSEGTIRNYTSGRNNPGANTLIKFSLFLGLSIRQIARLTNLDMKKYSKVGMINFNYLDYTKLSVSTDSKDSAILNFLIEYYPSDQDGLNVDSEVVNFCQNKIEDFTS